MFYSWKTDGPVTTLTVERGVNAIKSIDMPTGRVQRLAALRAAVGSPNLEIDAITKEHIVAYAFPEHTGLTPDVVENFKDNLKPLPFPLGPA